MKQQNLDNNANNNSMDYFVNKLFKNSVPYENDQEMVASGKDIVKDYTANNKVDLER